MAWHGPAVHKDVEEFLTFIIIIITPPPWFHCSFSQSTQVHCHWTKTLHTSWWTTCLSSSHSSTQHNHQIDCDSHISVKDRITNYTTKCSKHQCVKLLVMSFVWPQVAHHYTKSTTVFEDFKSFSFCMVTCLFKKYLNQTKKIVVNGSFSRHC